MSISFRRASLSAAAPVVVAAVAAGAVVSGSSGSVAATGGEPDARTVTVSGSGYASGTPDVVRLDLGVQRSGPDVNAALDAANSDIQRIKEVLARHGVSSADMQTSQLSINQHYGPIEPYGDSKPMPAPMGDAPAVAADPVAPAPSIAVPESGRSVMPVPPAPNGFEVHQSLSVKLRNLETAGKVISEAAAAGGNATRIHGVWFEFSDTEKLTKDARDQAFAAAKVKAEQYARLAGGSLGRVVSVSEGSEGGGGYPYPVAARDAGSASSVPLAPGSQQVGVTTTVVWELS